MYIHTLKKYITFCEKKKIFVLLVFCVAYTKHKNLINTLFLFFLTINNL